MKSSKIDNVPAFNASVEESKSLSPFTYYQPFQSSFDPEFAGCAAKGRGDSREPPGTPKSRWPRGVEKRGPGPGSSVRWDEESSPGGGTSGFEGELRGPGRGRKSAFPAVGGPAAGRGGEADAGSVVGMPRTSSWSGLPSSGSDRNPRHPFPEDQSSKYFANGEKSFGMSSSFAAQNQTSFAFASIDKQASGRSSVGGSSFRFGTAMKQFAQVSSGSERTTNDSVYYPLVLNPFAKDLSQNIYKTGHGRPMVCNFCKNNKEVPDIYLNHYLYDPETKILTCPVLRKHVCEICGGTGDRAHTLQYCPVNRKRGLQAKVPVLLKTRTITNSTGKIRRN